MDPATIGTTVAALAAVLALVGLSAQLLRRLRLVPATGPAGARRLALLEALPLDPKRRLLLLRCDGAEVLLLVGGPQDLVVTLPRGAA
jgi:flagellar protein FliO/FliZ